MEQQQQQQNKKGSHKEFNLWMISEMEDFFPKINQEDPLKRFYHLLDKNPSIAHHERKKLVLAKHPKVEKTIKHGPNFSIEKCWKQFTTKGSETLIKFLGLKDIIMLVYTCKYFKEELDQESTWRILKLRDFSPLNLRNLRDDTKDRVLEKLYYKYLYLSTISGIPYHSGYFKAYGAPDTVELADSIVDFLCPKTEVIKKYAGEILMRNQCKTFDFKLSWLKEKNEICLWNGNPSLEFRKPETGNEEVETVNEFYPCFIKRYSMVDEDEEIVEVFFLEDKYFVMKLFKRLEADRIMIIFRILNLEEELHSIAKGLQPATPFDYSFTTGDEKSKLVDMKIGDFRVDFVISQEMESDIKVNLLSKDRAAFYSANSARATIIFWDLKEKKTIDSASVELQKPLNSIIVSKKSSMSEAEKIQVILLDESMNVYCGTLSEKDGFILNQEIIFPTLNEEKVEDDAEKLKELEAKYYLNFGKNTRNIYTNKSSRHCLPVDSLYDVKKHLQFSEKARRYYHEIWNKTNEEWLIVHAQNNFHFINLDNEKIQEFSSGKTKAALTNGNWNIYEDNLVITDAREIRYYRIDFEERTIRFVFSREIKHLLVEKVFKQWIMFDPCFTVLVFTHAYELGFTARATIVVTSTQEFLYNKDPAFNLMSYKAQADHFIQIPDRWENKHLEIHIKFENSKVLVITEKGNFYFDMTLSSQPYSKTYLNGWMADQSVHMIKYAKTLVKVEAEPEVGAEEGEIKSTKPKMVNHMKLEGNPNTMNAKGKSNGWKNGGKSQAKKEEDKEHKVLKDKGDKYEKNIRQSQRSDKMN